MWRERGRPVAREAARSARESRSLLSPRRISCPSVVVVRVVIRHPPRRVRSGAALVRLCICGVALAFECVVVDWCWFIALLATCELEVRDCGGL